MPRGQLFPQQKVREVQHGRGQCRMDQGIEEFRE
jgi:hypothetical protein